jgi:uncharacterized protein YdaU (DUF1376 family)
MSGPSKLLAEWFWTDRWMGSSAFLLPLESRGLYREMLTQAWRRGGRLPNDHEAIKRAVGCTSGEWRRCWPKIEHYWRIDGDSLVNDTQADVIADAIAAHQRAVERGRKGGQKRVANLQEHLKNNLKRKLRPTRPHLQDTAKPPSPSLISSQDRSPVNGGADAQRTRQAEEDKTLGTGGFVRRFCELYSQYRNGARYHVVGSKHVPLLRSLLRTYGAERLEKLTVIMLNATADDWLNETDRGIEVLHTKINWLDSLLAEHESRRAS